MQVDNDAPRDEGDDASTSGPARDQWTSRVGVILAVAGSAQTFIVDRNNGPLTLRRPSDTRLKAIRAGHSTKLPRQPDEILHRQRFCAPLRVDPDGLQRLHRARNAFEALTEHFSALSECRFGQAFEDL